MSEFDVFPLRKISKRVRPINDSASYWETAIRYLRVTAFISFLEIANHRIFHRHESTEWTRKRKDNLCRSLKSAKNPVCFIPQDVSWDKIIGRLKKNPVLGLSNTDIRMSYRLDNMFLVKEGFTFGHWVVDEAECVHVFQTTDAPMLLYVTDQQFSRRSLSGLFHYTQYVLRPHHTYYVPQNTKYLVVAATKTLFSVDIVKGTSVSEEWTVCTTHRQLQEESPYDVPPPTPLCLPSQRVRPEQRVKRAAAQDTSGAKRQRVEEDPMPTPHSPGFCHQVDPMPCHCKEAHSSSMSCPARHKVQLSRPASSTHTASVPHHRCKTSDVEPEVISVLRDLRSVIADVFGDFSAFARKVADLKAMTDRGAKMAAFMELIVNSATDL